MTTGDSLVVIMDQKTVSSLIGRSTHILQELLKPRDDLLKSLFIHGLAVDLRGEVGLIHAFREQTGISPSCDTCRHFTNESNPLCPGKVRIGGSFSVVLLGLSVEIVFPGA